MQRITPENVTIDVTGDLTFFATMLGKTSMDSKWCFLCQLDFKEWAYVNKVNGLMWTRQALIDKNNAIQANANMKASNKQGVKCIAILDVDPNLFIPPPLYIKVGLVNRAFNKKFNRESTTFH